MARVVYSPQAQRSLERIFEFYAKQDIALAGRVLDVIYQAVSTLRHHPYIGRPAEEGLLELVISHGKTGFVALYDYDTNISRPAIQSPVATLEAPGRVHIRAIRHQREAGY